MAECEEMEFIDIEYLNSGNFNNNLIFNKNSNNLFKIG